MHAASCRRQATGSVLFDATKGPPRYAAVRCSSLIWPFAGVEAVAATIRIETTKAATAPEQQARRPALRLFMTVLLVVSRLSLLLYLRIERQQSDGLGARRPLPRAMSRYPPVGCRHVPHDARRLRGTRTSKVAEFLERDFLAWSNEAGHPGDSPGGVDFQRQ